MNHERLLARARTDEFSFVREWFPVLVELYQRTHARSRVLVIESIW